MRTTTSRSVLASATGALALSLLLAGCSAGGSDESTDEATSAAPESSSSPSASSDGSAGTGELAQLSSCEDAAERLGDVVAGLTLQQDQSSVTDEAATCAWVGDTSDPSNLEVYALQLQRQDIPESQLQGAAGQTAEQFGAQVVDDERATELGGQAVTGQTDVAGLPVSIGGVAIPTGFVVFTATGTGAASFTPEQALDASFTLID